MNKKLCFEIDCPAGLFNSIITDYKNETKNISYFRSKLVECIEWKIRDTEYIIARERANTKADWVYNFRVHHSGTWWSMPNYELSKINYLLDREIKDDKRLQEEYSDYEAGM